MRFSVYMKYIVVSLIFVFFTRTSIHSLAHHESINLKKISHGSGSYKIYGNSQDEVPRFKRKYKSKGLQVAILQITNLTFTKEWILIDFLNLSVKNFSISFLHEANLTRGPPIV